MSQNEEKGVDPAEIDTKGEVFGHGVDSTGIFWIAIVFSAFQIVTAAYSPLSSLPVRSIHVGFLLLMVFALYAAMGRGNPVKVATCWALGGLSFLLSLYHLVYEGDLVQRSGDPSTADLVVGTIMVALVFEAARRLMGWALPMLCLVFVAYAAFGEILPAPLGHRGYGYDQIVNQYFLGTEGIFGIPCYVSATYIFLFILFGSFLEQAGMIRLFTDVALGTVGHTKGGPAKVAVVTSGLMGTINGSGIANVVTTGQLTIPLMKRFGYRAEFAAAVEATASMGGQIMPPVMGAVAFIMAETLNISYAEVCKAAAIPALLYYASALWMVHLEAGIAGLHGMPKDQCPSAIGALKRQWYLMVPLAALVYLLLAGFTPMFSGTVGLALTAIVILGSSIAANIGGMAGRVVFWGVLGVASSAFFKLGINVVVGIVVALIAVNFFVRGGRETMNMTVRGLVEGARSAVPVGVACTLVGTIIGTMTLTGIAGTFTQGLVSMSGGSLFLTLVLTMIASLILGMGIPTIPTYIITSSLVAPMLFKMGVPLIVSHMYVFYFGILADLTPPVGLAAFAAASIARAKFAVTGIWAVRVAMAGFVVPFMAVYDPSLMMVSGSLLDTAYVVGKCLLAIGLWGAATIGYLWMPMRLWERGLAVAAAFLLVAAIPWTDQAGFALSALFLGWHWLQARKAVSA
ncbi:TRAP transporter 4TM/12TM fusion protein unknown substrate 1 [Paramagnetospirillum magnetotacticum MS-1]|uniref:TRAP C4-dicarboxylate transport system permease DctM subunit domain-containing protein n=1 Tax=Paramagnetospirillum magnetotacticum MS-1 TaxID=272627 RepID=A0A0C2YBA7_PARME|nr:TRAP transporter permease [Paramagnetospirillum magnetotacticum]KIL97029.1 TRAP transporter 4TM/12TM fusion protein unknown substrate 1 [Paramagnetospirillum magnetotacticum MS-1]